jgi:phosphohistidine phosphatase
MRHAKSSRKDPLLDDYDRPLTSRGSHDAKRVGWLLAEEGLLPDLIISSTARRTRDTVEHLIVAAGYRGPVRFCPELYLGQPADYLRVLAAVPDKHGRLMAVGHNPGLEELIGALTGENTELPTAGLAQVRLDMDGWRRLATEARGKLVRLWRPRDLK